MTAICHHNCIDRYAAALAEIFALNPIDQLNVQARHITSPQHIKTNHITLHHTAQCRRPHDAAYRSASVRLCLPIAL